MYAKPAIREADLRSEASACTSGIIGTHRGGTLPGACAPIDASSGGQTLDYLVALVGGEWNTSPVDRVTHILGTGVGIENNNQPIFQVCVDVTS